MTFSCLYLNEINSFIWLILLFGFTAAPNSVSAGKNHFNRVEDESGIACVILMDISL